jgi:hypothetical protein
MSPARTAVANRSFIFFTERARGMAVYGGLRIVVERMGVMI